ncbi:HNH endonuclease [Sutcliffiella horikoshii]|nr:HNH endonuclease [Sutcliffiella horikoshii]MCM3619172.1 HNH endonuclease [Sutcliffiella horikoshii]
MVRKPQRPCREIGCGKLTRDSYCEIHKKSQQEITRNYNQYNRDDKVNGFYQSTGWRRARRLALERDNHLCQRCIKQSKLQAAQLVHHIVEVKVDWSKRLELTNLESICHSCHNKHHKS